jgi:hypothetical protein
MEYVGIDVHKNQSQFCLFSKTGEEFHKAFSPSHTPLAAKHYPTASYFCGATAKMRLHFLSTTEMLYDRYSICKKAGCLRLPAHRATRATGQVPWQPAVSRT